MNKLGRVVQHLPRTSSVRLMVLMWTPSGAKTSTMYWPESFLSMWVSFSVPLLMKYSVLFLYSSCIVSFPLFSTNTFIYPEGSSFLHRSWWLVALVIIWIYTVPPNGTEHRDMLWLTLHVSIAAGTKAKEKLHTKEISLNMSPLCVVLQQFCKMCKKFLSFYHELSQLTSQEEKELVPWSRTV